MAIEDIDHTKTKARSPQTNGICERFHRTMQEEFFWTAFRKKIYQSVEELQKDLDQWIEFYNNQRPHSGKFCYGKTPMQTFKDSIHLAKEKMIDSQKLIFQNNVDFSFSTDPKKQQEDGNEKSDTHTLYFTNFEHKVKDKK